MPYLISERIYNENNIYKECKSCGKDKLLKYFQKNKYNSKHICYSNPCESCEYIRRKEKYKDRLNSYVKKQRDKESFTIEGRACMLRNRCKQRAKKYNYEFNLSKEKIISLLEIGVCNQTFIPIIFNDSTNNPYAPSVDRIDNDKGYTDDNIQIVCTIYNLCKNMFTDKQVKEFLNKINYYAK